MQRARRHIAAIASVALLWSVGALVVGPGVLQAQGPNLDLQMESREMFAGLPFVLALKAVGFEEEPTPEAPTIEITGCKVTYLGMTPSVSSMVQIINGRRSVSRDVTFVYRYRIEAPAAGSYTVGPVTLTQGGRSARSPGGQFSVGEVKTTPDMRIELGLPERAVYVGESFEMTIDWYLSRDVRDQSFVLPLFDENTIHVEPATLPGAPVLAFTAGARDIQLPYERRQVTVEGRGYTRFRFHAIVTPNRAGALELEPMRVVARLESGWGRDSFGFRVRRHELFKAEDEARRLSVRPLPQAGRPPSFAGAIGTSFSIAVQASRTVAQVGDPIELTIQLRGNGRLEGMGLPSLDADGGLAPELFSVPDETAAGEIDADGTVKTFRVTVRLKSVEATEIPALAFSYFDPGATAYRTVYSEPIALSVKGSRVVSADDVVRGSDAAGSGGIDEVGRAGSGGAAGGASGTGRGGARGGGGSAGQTSTGVAVYGSLVGADLSLSAPGATMSRAITPDDVRPLLLALYGLPLLAVAWCTWRVRTRARRGRASAIRERVSVVERALREAELEPAREVAPRLLASLRAVSRYGGELSAADRALLERIETEGYDPVAAEAPFDAAIVAEATAAVARWERQAMDRGGAVAWRRAAGLTALVACFAGSLAGTGIGVVGVVGVVRAVTAEPSAIAADLAGAGDRAPAASSIEVRLAEARQLYQQALADEDPVRRTRIFIAAERLLRPIAEQQGDCPELLVDWGNAALGAHELGRAALAYRRALRLDPGHERARKNLGWVRGRLPAWMPKPAQHRALDTLLFWHGSMSLARRHLFGALAFAVGCVMLAPWPVARLAALRRAAAVPLLVWVALTGSALLDRGDRAAAIVMVDGIELRSADSAGAPAAFASPLPAGAEVTWLESRDAWSRVALADGTRGWTRSHAIERVLAGG